VQQQLPSLPANNQTSCGSDIRLTFQRDDNATENRQLVHKTAFNNSTKSMKLHVVIEKEGTRRRRLKEQTNQTGSSPASLSAAFLPYSLAEHRKAAGRIQLTFSERETPTKCSRRRRRQHKKWRKVFSTKSTETLALTELASPKRTDRM